MVGRKRRDWDQAASEAGGSFAQLQTGGEWHSSASRLYLDLGIEEEKAMAEVLIENSDADAPEIPQKDERGADEGNSIP